MNLIGNLLLHPAKRIAERCAHFIIDGRRKPMGIAVDNGGNVWIGLDFDAVEPDDIIGVYRAEGLLTMERKIRAELEFALDSKPMTLAMRSRPEQRRAA